MASRFIEAASPGRSTQRAAIAPAIAAASPSPAFLRRRDVPVRLALIGDARDNRPAMGGALAGIVAARVAAAAAALTSADRLGPGGAARLVHEPAISPMPLTCAICSRLSSATGGEGSDSSAR